MAKKRKQRHWGKPHWHMTSREFQAVTFVTTLVLAGITMKLGINDPVVWSFLGIAIGIAAGRAAHSDRNR